jgi:hypothetical protein
MPDVITGALPTGLLSVGQAIEICQSVSAASGRGRSLDGQSSCGPEGGTLVGGAMEDRHETLHTETRVETFD